MTPSFMNAGSDSATRPRWHPVQQGQAMGKDDKIPIFKYISPGVFPCKHKSGKVRFMKSNR
ncbi:hypothetical protein DO021_21350 [Desulfobacter hydrogenophilus]|uniref:Uncharacterized protein n=1 Tax=Desulfobacter hydrogenophilus TaxID=2291 RepID=A0A328F9E0_9BACT|nr:hypothetical protein DO021_21350 [Desulfobacter hydrogenophilus]